MTTESRHPAEPTEYLSIGEVAKAFGVTIATVRNWDRAGRIHSERTPGNQRRFTRAEVARLKAAGARGDFVPQTSRPHTFTR